MSAPSNITIQVPSTGEGETIRVIVTVVNGQFYFDGQSQTDFKLIEGNTYIFQQSPLDGGGHVLGISDSSGGPILPDLVYSYNGTVAPASTYKIYLVDYGSFFESYQFEVTYTVPTGGPDTLYFFSTSSSVTGGTFVIKTPIQNEDSFSIYENDSGVIVGTLQTEDSDINDTHTYSLGGEDADLFEIVDGQLKLKNGTSANYESKAILNISITSTDSNGESFTKDFAINVVDQNDTPTSVSLSSLRLEDATDGYIVGTLSTTDEDTDDTHTYTLSGADADQFEVADNQLKLKDGISADFVTQGTYSVTVTSTDSGGETTETTFTLNVVTTIDLTSFSFAENSAGVLVGDLSVTDETFSSNITYSLSGTDGDKFEIVNNQLKLKDDVSANFEVQDSYSIIITVQDDAGLEAAINFTLSVTDENDAPTAVSISQEEPEPPTPTPTPGEGETIRVIVTVVNGQFYFDGQSQTDFKLIEGNTYIFQQSPLDGGGHVLGISDSSGGPILPDLVYSYNGTVAPASTYKIYLVDYGSFFESYQFEVTYTVPTGGPDTLYFFSTSSAVTGGTFAVSSGEVTPTPTPEPVDPDAIVINENELGAAVGTLITTDEDVNDTHTYTLSGADADLFEIEDGILKLKDSVTINYENKSSLFITITSVDLNGASYLQDMEILVNDVNEQPTDITLSGIEIDENIDGVVVGAIETIDEDTNDTYTYTFEGVDADKFEVVDGQLKLKEGVVADYESQTNYSVTVISTDSGGLFVSKDFIISINDVNEPVTSIKMGASNFATVEEGQVGAIVGALEIDDPDIGENRTYLVTGSHAKYFEVVDGNLKLKSDVSLDYESLFFNAIDTSGSYIKSLYISVTVIDSGGYTAINNFEIQVLNSNDPPNEIKLNGSMIYAGSNSGQVIGEIETFDQDQDDSFTYTVNNSNFEVVDGQLKIKNDIDLSGNIGDSLIVSVTVTDSANNSFTKSFELTFGSLTIDNNSFEENLENAVVATISISEGDVSAWTFSLKGSDSRFFEINSDGQIQFKGSADYEAKSSYELIITGTHDDGTSYESLQVIEVLDRNDKPSLWYSHANNLAFLPADTDLASRYLFGIKEEANNPYVLTLAIKDQDLSDSYTIKITYTTYTGYYYDSQLGKNVYIYEGETDITNLFTFDAATGSLHFNGQVDFETKGDNLSGLDQSHRWYDPITITIIDASGAQDTMTVLMDTWDSSSDGLFNISNTGAYTNFNDEIPYPFFTGPIDIDTYKYPELRHLVKGDINGDGIPDNIALYVNSDYYYPSTYAFLSISLGGAFAFPHFQPDVYTWGGLNDWNSVLGNGLGSVIVNLPQGFGDLRDWSYNLNALESGDFTGDGKDDVLFQVGDYLIVGFGDEFDNAGVQGTNIMDLYNVWNDQTNGVVIDLTMYTDWAWHQLLVVGDLNGDGQDDLVFTGPENSLLIVEGRSGSFDLISTEQISGNNIQFDINFGDSVAIGDFNGDGRLDLAVSADGYDKDTLNDSDEGAVLIYLGGFSGLATSPSISILGYAPSDEIGYYGIVNLGDINGDGRDDLGFGDDDDISYIFWGTSSYSAVYDLFDEFPNSLNFTAIDDFGDFDITNVTAVGDINGDGYDDIAAVSGDKILVLYGQMNWDDLYEDQSGLNILEITNAENYWPNIYALGDIDSDGKDEFGFSATSDNAYYLNDLLLIWNGHDSNVDANGFSLPLEQNFFSVDENIQGAEIGRLEVDGVQNLSNYSFFIVSVSADGEVLSGNLFEITADGTLKLNDSITLNAEDHSSYSLRVFIVDQQNDQISQHYIEVVVNNINEAPSISLSNRFVENSATDGLVGVLTSLDPDNDQITFTLTGIDADKFIIDDETGELRFAEGVIVDSSIQASYNIIINAADSYGLSSSQDFTIEVNMAPTDIHLDGLIIQEGIVGVAIGNITVSDANSTEEFTYAISGVGPLGDNNYWYFEVTDDGILKLNDYSYLKYHDTPNITLTITATDSQGNSISKDFTLEVVNLDHATPDGPSPIESYFIVEPYWDARVNAMLMGKTLDPDLDPTNPLVITYSIIYPDTSVMGATFNSYAESWSYLIDPTQDFISAVVKAFEYVSSVTGITFIRVEETETLVGDIRMGLNTSPEYGGVSYSIPHWYYTWQSYDELTYGSADLDIFISGSSDENFDEGSYGWMTILHEIGHSIGLKHPQENQGYPWVSIDETGYTYMGWVGYSVMDYRHYIGDSYAPSEEHHHGDEFAHYCTVCSQNQLISTWIEITETGESFYPTTFMPLDLYALAYLYDYDSVNEDWYGNNVNEGDDTYVLDGPFFMTIFDTGGEDTLDWSNKDWNSTVDFNFLGLSYFGTDKISFYDGSPQEDEENLLAKTGWILGLGPYAFIENILAGSGDDFIQLNNYHLLANLVRAGAGDDQVTNISHADEIYGGEGNDDFHASSMTFSLIDGGMGSDTLTIDQALMENGLYSVDLRTLSEGQVTNIEYLNYDSNHVQGSGQILISSKTFTDLGKTLLVIYSTWNDALTQAVGLEGDFKLAGFTGEYDIYTLSENGEIYTLFVWKDHYVFKIDDSSLEISLSNTVVAEETWSFVGDITLAGDDWINPLYWDKSLYYTPNYSLSGEDAELFQIIDTRLYFRSATDYETKQSYSVTITGLSLSGKTVSKTFTIEVKDVDELSYTSSDDVIAGTDSDDYLYGGSGNDTISGGLGNDNLTGGAGDDLIYGNEGNDSLFGWGGDDEIHGGTGDDLIYGHEDPDKLYGDEGNDIIHGWGGDDHIEGGSGIDKIYGDSGNDFLYGDSESGESDTDGNDIISAGSGDDVVWGRGGDDVIYGMSGDDTIRGGSGNDILKGGSGNDTLIGQSGDDTLEGGDGDDLLYGDNETGESLIDGNDILYGGLGNDEIYGRDGDDYLVGQEGQDTLTGGLGNDVFVLTSYGITGPAQHDTIKDFVDGEDKIGLINLDFDSLVINQIGFGVDANTEITDSNGYTLAILEGVTSDLITADDFVSLNYDLSEVIDTTALSLDLNFDSLGIETNPSQDANPDSNGERSSNPDVPITDDQPNFNDRINGDLIDSLIDQNHLDDYSINDFI